uniref:atlastin-2-like n=1 Tax=Styela clava TaxID=7725 RepID=UPI001939C2F6|nr:atlastin-2-like [Styela clava]
MACGGKPISKKLYTRENYETAEVSSGKRQINDPDHKIIPIAYEEDSHLQLNLDALKIVLSNPLIGDKPISIISVAGQYRTGKSFLLNFFIRYLRNKGWKNCDWIGDESTKVTDGIDWQKETEAHTKRILMWPEIFVVKDRGNEVAILLMDTQGLFDTDTDSDTNARILSVSTLLSSHQILHLQLCSNHAKAATRNVRKESVFNEPFQTLTFLVCDWQYQFEHKYGDGGMVYLDGILIRTSKSTEVNSVKKSVRNAFSNVRCFLMPHPGDDVLRRSKMNVTNKELGEDFITMVQELATKVLHPKNLVIKKIEGKTLTGNQILELMSTSCKQAVSMWKLENYHEKAMKSAKRNFQQNAKFGSEVIKIACWSLYVVADDVKKVLNFYPQHYKVCSWYLFLSSQRKQIEVASSAKESCLYVYQSNMNKVFKDETLSPRNLQMFHDKHRKTALRLLRSEVASLISDYDQILAWGTKHVKNLYSHTKNLVAVSSIFSRYKALSHGVLLIKVD